MKRLKKSIIIALLLFVVGGTQRLVAEPSIPKSGIPKNIPASLKLEIENLYSPYYYERSNSLRMLASLKDEAKAAVPFIASMVAEYGVEDFPQTLPSKSIPFKVVFALGSIDTPLSTEKLIELLNHDSNGIRSMAWGTLNTHRQGWETSEVAKSLLVKSLENLHEEFMAFGDLKEGETLPDKLSRATGIIKALSAIPDYNDRLDEFLLSKEGKANEGFARYTASLKRGKTSSGFSLNGVDGKAELNDAELIALYKKAEGDEKEDILSRISRKVIASSRYPNVTIEIYKELIPQFVKRFYDEKEHVRRYARMVLTSLGWAPESIDEKVRFYIKDSKKLIALGKEAIEPMIKAAKESKALSVNIGLVAALDELQPDWYSQLPKGELVLKFISGLGNKSDSITLATLEKIDPGWRQSEVVNEYVAGLVGLLSDDRLPFFQAERIFKKLNVISSPFAVEPLERFLRKRQSSVYEQNSNQMRMIKMIAKTLGALSDKKSIESLKVLTKHQSQEVRFAAYNALKKCGWKPETLNEEVRLLLLKSSRGRRTSPNPEIVKLGEKALKPLIEIMMEYDVGYKKSAAFELNGLGWKPVTDDEMIHFLIGLEKWEELVWLGAPATEQIILYINKNDYLPDALSRRAKRIAKEDGYSVIERIIPLLRSKKHSIRRFAAEVLAEIGDPIAIEPLSDVIYRTEIILESRLTKDRTVIQKTSSNEKNTYKAVLVALGKFKDPRVIRPLLEVLSSEHQVGMREAIESISNLKEIAVLPLINALKEKKPNVRYGAVKALELIGDKRAVEPIIDLLDSDPEAILPAVHALIKIGGKRGTKPIARAMAKTGIYITQKIEKMTQKYGEAERKLFSDEAFRILVPNLLRNLDATEEEVRKLSVKMLGKVGDPKAIPALFKLYKQEKSKYFKKNILKVLDSLRWKPVTVDDKVYALATNDDYDGLVKIGKPAIEPLLNILSANDPEYRNIVISVLIELGWQPDTLEGKINLHITKKEYDEAIEAGKEDWPKFYSLIKNDRSSKDEIIRRLTKTEGAEYVEILLIFSNERLNENIILALSKYDDIRIEEFFLGLFVRGENLMRSRAVVLKALRGADDVIRTRAFNHFLDQYTNGSHNVKRNALYRLGELGGKRPTDFLLELLNNAKKNLADAKLSGVNVYMNELRKTEAVISALGSSGDERAVEPLIDRFKSEKPVQRHFMAKALGMIGDKRAVKPLLNALKVGTNSTADSSELVKALGMLGDASAVEPLIAFLDKGDKRKVIVALGELRDKRALKPLMAILKKNGREKRYAEKALTKIDADWKSSDEYREAEGERILAAADMLGAFSADERREAAEELIKSKDPKAIDILVKAMYSGNTVVAKNAATALMKKGWSPKDKDEEALQIVLAKSMVYGGFKPDEVVNYGSTAFKYLVDILKRKDNAACGAAFRMLQINSTKAIGIILNELDSDQCDECLAGFLSRTGEPRAVPPLIDQLKSRCDTSRSNAAFALGELGDPRAVEPLIRALNSSDDLDYLNIIIALGKLGDRRATEHLLNELHSSRANEFEIANALAIIADKRAVKPLIKLMREKGSEGAVAYALGAIGDSRAVEPLIKKLNEVDVYNRHYYIAALIAIGDAQAIEPLEKILTEGKRKDGFIVLAIEKLKMKNSAELKDLIANISGSTGSANIIKSAIFKLDKMRDSAYSAIPPLILMTKNSDKEIRLLALSAINAILRDEKTEAEEYKGMVAFWGKEEADKKLAAMGQKKGNIKSKEETRSRRKAVSLLSKKKLYREIMKAFVAALDDEDATVRAIAIRLTALNGYHNVVEPLLNKLEDKDTGVRKEAVTALGTIVNHRSVAPLIKALNDDNKDVKREAIVALGQIGDARAVKPLISLLDDNELSKAVAGALNEILSLKRGDDPKFLEEWWNENSLYFDELDGEFMDLPRRGSAPKPVNTEPSQKAQADKKDDKKTIQNPEKMPAMKHVVNNFDDMTGAKVATPIIKSVPKDLIEISSDIPYPSTASIKAAEFKKNGICRVYVRFNINEKGEISRMTVKNPRSKAEQKKYKIFVDTVLNRIKQWTFKKSSGTGFVDVRFSLE